MVYTVTSPARARCSRNRGSLDKVRAGAPVLSEVILSKERVGDRGTVVMTKPRRVTVLVGLLLVMMLLFATPAHASGVDAAENISSSLWCALGYYEYC